MFYQRKFIETLNERFASDSLEFIQVLLGPRQVGKTTGVNYFLSKYKKPYFYVSADDLVAPGRDWLLEQWQKAKELGHGSLLVIDEIQKVTNWSEVIKGLWDKQKIKQEIQIKLLLLGSSSLSIQIGLTESLAGRFELIKTYHWSYLETKKFLKWTIDQYLKYGGYPGSYTLIDQEDRWRNYVLASIIEPVINKDILNFARVKNPALFRQAFEVIAGYPAQEISYIKILGQLQDRGNVDLVKHYIEMYEGAFLFCRLEKYTRKKHLTKGSSPKIIPMAPCFYTLLAQQVGDNKKGRVFEATVGAALMQETGKLYYWREAAFEVDFIFENSKGLFAIEVKSGRKKKQGGITLFCNRFPNAIPVFIDSDNYEKFLTSPEKFLSDIGK
ncbi:MAG: hypothetical protein A3F16_03240 [Deltaproteobacteria bacterium RIFCSPHIGHO2_12_FULL_43_9]|nr:MAG: hypothetical protein A3F16_03240 [Deltaproteobacteria bacterium RIFCSPHIGHO2_12_FULL_43_9]